MIHTFWPLLDGLFPPSNLPMSPLIHQNLMENVSPNLMKSVSRTFFDLWIFGVWLRRRIMNWRLLRWLSEFFPPTWHEITTHAIFLYHSCTTLYQSAIRKSSSQKLLTRSASSRTLFKRLSRTGSLAYMASRKLCVTYKGWTQCLWKTCPTKWPSDKTHMENHGKLENENCSYRKTIYET